MTSATEVLIDAMDSLKAGEALAMLIVWTDENGNLSIRMSCTSSHAIGLAVYAKDFLMQGLLGGEI